MSPRSHESNELMRSEALARISAAAFEVFLGFGYHGATMKMIAQASGQSYGLVYHYFRSKEAVYRHLVDQALDASISTISAGLKGEGTAWERIEKLSATMEREALTGQARQYFLFMLQALHQGRSLPGLLEHIAERSAQHYAVFIPILARAQAEGRAIQGDPATLAAAYFTFVQGLSLMAEGGRAPELPPGLIANVLRNPRYLEHPL